MECCLIRCVTQLAESSEQKQCSFCPATPAPESQAAKATASACPAGSASPNLGPRIRRGRYRPPWQTQGRLPRPPLDLREQVSKPLPLTVGPLRDCRKPLVVEQKPPDRSLHFLCCPLGQQNPQPVWSIPTLCQDARRRLRCRRQAPARHSHNRAYPQTTAAVPPSLKSPYPERLERTAQRVVCSHPVFVPGPRE